MLTVTTTTTTTIRGMIKLKDENAVANPLIVNFYTGGRNHFMNILALSSREQQHNFGVINKLISTDKRLDLAKVAGLIEGLINNTEFSFDGDIVAVHGDSSFPGLKDILREKGLIQKGIEGNDLGRRK